MQPGVPLGSDKTGSQLTNSQRHYRQGHRQEQIGSVDFLLLVRAPAFQTFPIVLSSLGTRDHARLGNLVPRARAWEIAQSGFGYFDGKKTKN